MTVDPVVGTEYRLTVAKGTASKTLGAQIALGADIVSYALGRGGLVAFRNSTGTTEVEAARVSAEVTGPLSATAKQRLVGKVLEVHLIPQTVSLTSLPYWKYLAGQSTCHGEPEPCATPEPWSEVRGAGDSHSPLKPATTVAIAAGAETMFRSPDHFYADGGSSSSTSSATPSSATPSRRSKRTSPPPVTPASSAGTSTAARS
jgi:hypothetical protein